MTERVGEGELVRLIDFHALQRSHLAETNKLLEGSLARGSITPVIDRLEFLLPVREVVHKGKKDLFVLYRGKPEPGDRFLRVRITQELQAAEVSIPQ
jgi:hypothetical protein